MKPNLGPARIKTGDLARLLPIPLFHPRDEIPEAVEPTDKKGMRSDRQPTGLPRSPTIGGGKNQIGLFSAQAENCESSVASVETPGGYPREGRPTQAHAPKKDSAPP